MNYCPSAIEIDAFGTEHHDLVYKFLNSKGLPEDDFYDVVVFGYLQAVKKYLTRPELRDELSFSTIAYRKMKDALSKHYEAQNRKKRKGDTISLDAPFYKKDGSRSLTIEDVLAAQDTEMEELRLKLLLLEIASQVSKKEMDVIRMKLNGYGVRDIARRQSSTIPQIKKMLNELHSIVISVCTN